MFRIQLTTNSTNKNPDPEKIILVKDYQELKKQASQKFKINPSKLRLFVAKPVINANVGTEVLSDDEFQVIISDDLMLAVSNGEAFRRKILKTKNIVITEDILKKLKRPPKYPFPKIKLDKDSVDPQVIIGIQVKTEEMFQSNINIKETNYTKELWENKFPILSGNVFNLIKKTVLSHEKIVMTENNGFISFDYDDNMIFPDVKTWEDSLFRECRGLIISSVTGKVLARRFHKFFNINENDESNTLFHQTCLSASAYEKLDGTLVTPILLDSGDMIWATRKIRNLEIEKFISSSLIGYNDFSLNYLKTDITPIFEYCHDTTPVGVLCYPEKKLVLIALRNNKTGQYYDIYNQDSGLESFNIPLVQRIEFDSYQDLISNAKSHVGKEGIVIYSNNSLYKCKSNWYMTMIKSQNTGQKMFLAEYVGRTGSLINVPLNKMFIFAILYFDDEMAHVCDLLTDKKQISELRKFVQTVQKNILVLESQLKEWLIDGFKITQDKNILLSIAESAGWDAEMLNDIYESKSITTKLKSFLCNFAKQNSPEIIAELLDISWTPENCKINSGNQILDIINFEECNQEITNHVLTKYLPKKVANLFGTKQVFPDTIINFPSTYVGNEGKIIGMYELFAEKYNIWDLRINLQPQRKEYSSHYGNSEYANLLVQSGKMNDKSVSYAGLLIPTNSDYCYADIVNGLTQSFSERKMIKLKRKTVLESNHKVFCDLDGVLVDFDKGILDLTGKPIHMQASSKMWQRVGNCPNFFEKLDFTSYGKKMWESIVEITGSNPVILTGIPSSSNKRYEVEKKNWCSNNLGPDVEVITCNSSDKYKYASDGYVLIDDRLEMGRTWQANGGIFVHHISPERTIHELEKIFEKNIKEKQLLEFKETDVLDQYVSNTNSTIVTDVWADELNSICTSDELNKFICIDSEWKHDGSTNIVSIVQICVKNKVFIVDMLQCTDTIKEQLELLLMNKSVTKICFGLSENECFRIGCDIINVLDIQEICASSFSNFSSGYVPSLDLVCALFLNKKMTKSKEQSLSDWDVRPFTKQQLKYASDDVTVLYEVYDKLKSELNLIKPYHIKNIYNPKSITIKKSKTEYNFDIPVKICFSGIFLTPSSKKELLKVIKPIFSNVHCDHILLKTSPDKSYLSNLKIGDMVSAKITGEYVDDKIQIVECEYKETKLHIVVSSLLQIYDVDTNTVCKNTEQIQKQVTIFGLIGIVCQQESDELVLLPEKIKTKILQFKTNAYPNENLKFKPNELSASERSIIHEYAKNNNMMSESSGKATDRQLTLTKKRSTENSNLKELISDEEKIKIKITDQSQYSLLNVIFGENLELNYDAKITENGFEISNEKLNTLLKSKNKLIILRGAPGSGKSFLTKNLDTIPFLSSAEICSADDYFDTDGVYKFNKDSLQKAHDFCYNTCVEYLHKKYQNVVIDNTHSTLREYAKYLNAGKCFNYTTIVLEIHCKTKECVDIFHKRCTHGVPISECQKMLSRWETDDNAFLVEPYFEKKTQVIKSLHKWLTEMKLYHFSKIRNKSHIIMAIGNQPACFLDIPDSMYDEFCQRYSSSVLDGTEHVYIMEFASRFDKFRFFIDFDYVGDDELTKEEIISYVKILQELLSKDMRDVYVTGCISSNTNNKIKTGLHFKCPNYMVNSSEATEIKNKYIKSLEELNSKINWSNIVDGSVYKDNCGIKMIGSRKVTGMIDVGRVHQLMFVLDQEGNESAKQLSNYELVKTLSIYNK